MAHRKQIIRRYRDALVAWFHDRKKARLKSLHALQGTMKVATKKGAFVVKDPVEAHTCAQSYRTDPQYKDLLEPCFEEVFNKTAYAKVAEQLGELLPGIEKTNDQEVYSVAFKGMGNISLDMTLDEAIESAKEESDAS